MTRVLSIVAALLAVMTALPARAGQSAFVDVGGVCLHYVDWGGTGEAIVFVPGGCDTAFVFDDLAPALTDRFHVLGLTPRGCGESGRAVDGYGIDAQIAELIGFLDAQHIERAIFAGHSSGAGKIIRLARLHPERVSRVIAFDVVYTNVPHAYDARMEAAIAAKTGARGPLSLDSIRRDFQAWELGAWSPALERDIREKTVDDHGVLTYRPAAPGWQEAFAADLAAGRYAETRIAQPALMFFSRDLDLERIRQFPPATRRALQPLAAAITTSRRDQVRAYADNGPHVQIVRLRRASHYLFIDHRDEVVSRIGAFLTNTAAP